MNQDTRKLFVVKIPIEHRAFIEANPRVAKVIGSSISQLVEIYEKIEKAKSIITDPNFISSFIDNGTVEQALKFINAALESAKGDTAKINNVSREVLDLVKEKLGNDIFETIF